MRSPGQVAYEADCAAAPLYHDGRHRPPWSTLDGPVRSNWERYPSPRWVGSTFLANAGLYCAARPDTHRQHGAAIAAMLQALEA